MKWFRLCHNEAEVSTFLDDVSDMAHRKVKNYIEFGLKEFPLYVSYVQESYRIGYMPLHRSCGSCSKAWYEDNNYVHYPACPSEILT